MHLLKQQKNTNPSIADNKKINAIKVQNQRQGFRQQELLMILWRVGEKLGLEWKNTSTCYGGIIPTLQKVSNCGRNRH